MKDINISSAKPSNNARKRGIKKKRDKYKLRRFLNRKTRQFLQKKLQRRKIRSNRKGTKKILRGEWEMSFLESKNKFDKKYGKILNLDKSLVPVNGKYIKDISLKNKKNEPSEEYYKWQFIYALIDSGLYSKDYLGVEVLFPKGNKNAAPIKIDGCIFDDKNWIDYYEKWRERKDDDAVEWLRKHLIGIIEFKKADDKDIKKVFTSQIKAYLKESENSYCMGFYYNTERLYIFQKKNGVVVRYDESKNKNGDKSSTNEISLDLMDGYIFIPSFENLIKRVNRFLDIDRGKRIIDDLDVITGAHSVQINNAISNILRTLDKVGLVNQRGYEILIQMLALKIFDEKRSQEYKKYLKFYATNKEIKKFRLMFYIRDNEKSYAKLSDENIQEFVKRIKKLYEDAYVKYQNILKTKSINWKNASHIKAISSVVENLQDYSFIKSYKSDLYQLVFYKFANAFTKSEKAQFLTPLQLIDFLVKIVNPRNGESIIDPTVGIADFLSMSYVNANGSLDDKNIYGVDNDEHMIMLAQLNMLLNGDGNAVLKHKPDKGSILYKFNTDEELIELDTKLHKNGSWDNWADETKLMKFNVVLTNPPFGEDRSYEVKNQRDKEIIEMYELWDYTNRKKTIDLGLVFLENAYRVLKEEGRLGIVLSNSIMSTGTKNKDPKGFRMARKWLLDNTRVVAVFDLPPNVFADVGVNVTLVVAYKPKQKELERLKSQGYKIFTRDIKKVGYEIRTSKRVKYYNTLFKVNEETFEVEQDEEGNPKLDEEFSQIIKDFKDWAKTQEKTLKDLFLD